METLADRIARHGPVNELDAVGWTIRLARRLDALHALGVAHGSVSPACVAADGVERTAPAILVDVQRLKSAPAFQSPERALGGDLSPADDTWAVAAFLYALLTARSPFAGGNDAETRQKILAATPAPLATYDVGDDDLQHILDRAFARELAARTSTVAALRRALEEWHPDPTVGALPPLGDEATGPADDDHDDERTIMRAPVFDDDDDDARTIMRDPPPASGVAAPQGRTAGHAVDDDDDDDNVRTVMRPPSAPDTALDGSQGAPGVWADPLAAERTVAFPMPIASPEAAPRAMADAFAPPGARPAGPGQMAWAGAAPTAGAAPAAGPGMHAALMAPAPMAAAPMASPWAPDAVPAIKPLAPIGPIPGQPRTGASRGMIIIAVLVLLVVGVATYFLLHFHAFG